MSEFLGYLHHWEQLVQSQSDVTPVKEESYDSKQRDSRRDQNDWLVTSSVQYLCYITITFSIYSALLCGPHKMYPNQVQ